MSTATLAPPQPREAASPCPPHATGWDLDRVPGLVRRSAREVLAEVSVDGAGMLHTTTQCPHATDSGRRPLPIEQLGVLPACPLCAPLQHATTLSGPPGPARLARLSYAVASLLAHLGPADRGDAVALANAGIAAAAAHASYRELVSGAHGPAATAAASQLVVLRGACGRLVTLRDLHRQALGVEVLRRWLVGPDGPDDHGADGLSLPPAAWRAARWAVRNGCDPLLAAAIHLEGGERRPLRRWLDGLAETACHAAAGPDHVMVASPVSNAAEGARPATLAALGFDVAGATKPAARLVPARLAEALEPGYPGVRIGDAGPCPAMPAGQLPEILEAFAGLWQPDTAGPLHSAPAALDAALRIVDVRR